MSAALVIAGKKIPIRTPAEGIDVVSQVLRRKPSAAMAAALGKAVAVVASNAVAVIPKKKRGAIIAITSLVRAIKEGRLDLVASHAVLFAIQLLAGVTQEAGLHRSSLAPLFVKTFVKELQAQMPKKQKAPKAERANEEGEEGKSETEEKAEPPDDPSLYEDVEDIDDLDIDAL